MKRHSILALALVPAFAAAQAPSQRVIDRYKEILAANPAEGTALDRLWQAAAEQGKTGPLISEFSGETDYAACMIHGLLLRKAGHLEEAGAAFERARKYDPKAPAPLLALAKLDRAASRHSQAVAHLNAAVELIGDGPAKIAILLDLGAAALATGDLTAATEAWEKTVALSPTDLALRRQLADTYARNHLGTRAIPHLEWIEKNAPPQDRARALQQIASIHQTAGREDDAIDALDRAIAVTGPQNYLRAELQSQLLRLHQRYHRVPELEQRLRKAAGENPRDLGVLLQLIDFYERTGEQHQLLEWLEKLVSLAPKNPDYRLRLARLLSQLDLLDRAAASYDALLKAQPGNIELVFERARIDVQRNQPQLAGERIAALITRSSGDGAVQARALEFYHAHSLHDLAERHFREDAAGGKDDALVALANFLFSRHRDDEARRTLAQLVRRADSPDRQAAAQFRIAGELKSQNALDGASEAARAATELRSDVREYHFLLGELEAAAGRYAGAEVAFERAFACSHTAAEALEADQRLYDSLRNQKEAGEDDSRTPPRPDSAAAATSSAAQAYLLNLTREAVETPTEDRWLRIARWQQWSRNQRAAVDAAERTLALNPRSLAAHDFLSRLFATDSQGAGAISHLTKLAKLDPANEAAYLRRLGQVQLQLGNTPDALRTFTDLVQKNPGDLDLLGDLAVAQQRADRWPDSLVTLRQIHDLSPASKKRDASISLLRAYDRLAMPRDAAALLLAQIDSASETKDRFSLFQDLLALCTRANLLDWLRTECERRHNTRADDYFTEMALGRVLKAQGEKSAAFQVLSDAALSAPNPAESLPELIREAEELHRFQAAIDLQAQYLRIVPQSGWEGFVRLAEMQEKNLQPAEASKTWARLASRFPRDVRVLERAAAFERVWGSPAQAISLLRRVREIEPTNLRSIAQLAELSLAEGLDKEAAECLEQVLAQLPPEKPGDPVRYPAVRPNDPSRLEIAYRTTVRRRAGRPSDDALRALRTFWFEKARDTQGSTDRLTRLEVIRDIAQIVAAKPGQPAFQRWVERWQKPEAGTSERLWALYFAGASRPLLDEVEALIAKAPGDNDAVNGFIWLAFDTGEFDRLATWWRDKRRTPAERDFLMVALEQYLEAHDGPAPLRMVETLFPNSQRTLIWSAAKSFAQHGDFREAARLGDRVFESLTTQRASVGLQLAQWRLMLGEIDGAREVLRTARGGSGTTLTGEQYQALRALYLLLPEPERAAFASQTEATLNEQKAPLHAFMTRALLAGLAGDEASARKHLDKVASLRALSSPSDNERATATTRHWDFLLTTGIQLAAWNLDRLTSYLWEQTFADEAEISLETQLPGQGDAVRSLVSEVRSRFVALRLMRAEPNEFDAVLRDYERFTPVDGFLPLAEALDSMGAAPVAISIYRRIWEAEPANPQALREVLRACRTANDSITLEEILTRTVTDGTYRQNEVAHRDFVQQLAEVLARKGDFDKAGAFLAEVTDRPLPDTRVLIRIANLHERASQIVEAEKIYRRVLSVEPANIPGRVALAAMLSSVGKTSDAIDILERVNGPGVDARLAALYLKSGRRDEALAALDRIPPSEHPHTALELAETLQAAGDAEQALLILRASLSRTENETQAYALQSRIVQLLPPSGDHTLAERELRRLAHFATAERIDRAAYCELASRQSTRLGLSAEYRAGLVREWDAGRGDPASGLALVLLQPREEALVTWRQLAAHPALDGVLAKSAAAALREKDAPTESANALGLAARLEPRESQNLTAWAKALAALGKKQDASRVAAEIEARSIFAPSLLIPAAETFAAIGDSKHAMNLYARAVAADPSAQRSDVHFALAALQVQARDFTGASRTLRNAARNPAAQITEPVIAFLTAAGRVEQFEEETATFPLAPSTREAMRRAVFKAHIAAARTGAALALVEDHLELIDAATCEILGTAADPARTAAVIERALSQRAIPGVAPVLARIYSGMAKKELASFQFDAALPLLKRAHELDRSLWEAAEQLARLYSDRKATTDAARVLRSFLGVTADTPARLAAERLLARIQPR